MDCMTSIGMKSGKGQERKEKRMTLLKQCHFFDTHPSQPCSFSELVNTLGKRYDSEPVELIRRDVKQFLDDMTQLELAEEC